MAGAQRRWQKGVGDGSEAGASRGQVGIWGEKNPCRHRRLSLVSRDFQAGFARRMDGPGRAPGLFQLLAPGPDFGPR